MSDAITDADPKIGSNTGGVLLSVEDLHVYYESSHVLQGVSLALERGVTGIIGRNGMGKTTLVKAIMGLVPVKSGRIILNGKDVTNLRPYQIAGRGVGYVPQGRGIFPSLTVDEHLRLTARSDGGREWTRDRVYELFPRLRERARQGAASLSGGEQQMLAIGRALVINPTLLIMDEPSEGLAPVILESLIGTFQTLSESGLNILLIEQNLHTAVAMVPGDLNVMIAGQDIQRVRGELLLSDEKVRERLLGVAAHEGSHSKDRGFIQAPDTTIDAM